MKCLQTFTNVWYIKTETPQYNRFITYLLLKYLPNSSVKFPKEKGIVIDNNHIVISKSIALCISAFRLNFGYIFSNIKIEPKISMWKHE